MVSSTLSVRRRIMEQHAYRPSDPLVAWRSRLPTRGSTVEGQTIKEPKDVVITTTGARECK